MSTEPLRVDKYDRVPDSKSEGRLLELRHEAQAKGKLGLTGIRPAGAPFPQASAEAGYYGTPLLKEPQWKWEVPIYFFAGGAAGSSALIGAMADWVGHDPELARDARWVATGGAMLSAGLLIADLGRPDRFLNMLRVFKRQSPMSVGAWVLAAFGSCSGAASFARWAQKRTDLGPVRVLGNAGECLSALLGLPLATYTGVLIGATAIPVWNQSAETLPLHFGMSGLNSGVSLLELLGHDRSRSLNLLGILSGAVESWYGFHIETSHEPALEPLKHGPSGRLTRAGGILSGPLPLALRLASAISGSRRTRRLAAYASLAGSLITRYAWIHAGRVSARGSRRPLDLGEQKRSAQTISTRKRVEAEEQPRLAG